MPPRQFVPYQPAAGGPRYCRRRPEDSTLHALMRTHAAAFFARAEAAGARLPGFVKAEFDAYLACGRLEHGFVRLRCASCGHDEALAFSCKRRGFCPSCGTRRMEATAAHLVDRVFPPVPVRQFVLSLPIALRLLLAARPGLLGGRRWAWCSACWRGIWRPGRACAAAPPVGPAR